MSYEDDMSRARKLVSELKEIFDRYEVKAPPGPVPPKVEEKPITYIVVETKEKKVPITWGQVFSVGHVRTDDSLDARWEDGTTAGLQMEVKATHADGSVRHAVISAIAGPGRMDIVKGDGKYPEKNGKAIQSVIVTIRIDSQEYTARPILTGDCWLDGPIVTEYNGSASLLGNDGKEHPHLHARFAMRCYSGGETRVDVIIENDWAYEPNPQNFTYDVSVEVGNKVIYEQKGLTHYHHARWRKILWVGRPEPVVNIKHDAEYVIGSMALPNYDTSLVIPEKTLDEWAKRWDKAGKGPMQVGLSVKAMSNTGGRADIAVVPAWGVIWLLSGDARMAEMTIETADMAGSWSIHYRDKDTGRPISLIDYPYMTTLGNKGDTRNPDKVDPETGKKGLFEAFPVVAKSEKNPYSHDSAHQPGFSYLPYLLTGDLYHLEELQFWASWCVFSTNPGYRKNVQGLLWRQQVRGIAWSLRTLAQAAYITPDVDPLKEYFLQVIDSNLEYGRQTFVDAPESNKLGAFTGTGAVVYESASAIGTFQDDFLTWALGYTYELGFEKALPLLEWKAKFPIERLVGKGTNWLAAVNYAWPVKANSESNEFTTIAEAYQELRKRKDSAELARLDSGGTDLGGYPKNTDGFPANAQPAVAAAARFNPKAWEQFEKRSPKPNYATGPQFAVLPRTV